MADVSPEEFSLIQQAQVLTGDPAAAQGMLPDADKVDFASPNRPPGRGQSDPELVKLLGEDADTFAAELCDSITEAEVSMRGRREREKELWQYYNQSSDNLHGDYHDTETNLTSEMLMMHCDQSAARLHGNMMNVKPLPQGVPVVRSESGKSAAEEYAKECEKFLHSFMMNKCDLRRVSREALLHTAVVGTSVIHPVWKTGQDEFKTVVDGEKVEKSAKNHWVELQHLDNTNVFMWPVTQTNWQKATIIGHRMPMTTPELHAYGADLDLTKEEYEQIKASGADPQDMGVSHELSMAQQGIQQSQELEQKYGGHMLTKLFARVSLPGERNKTRNIMAIIDERGRKILRIWKNPYAEGHFPYFPLRHKVLPNQAWGQGVGDECIQMQAADSALWNLSISNVRNGAFFTHQVKAGSTAAMQVSSIHPNEVLVVDNPGQDFVSEQLGGQAQGIEEATEDNRFRGRSATGQASAFAGQADPMLKSGASTGQTQLLKAEADKKIGFVDGQLRDDWSDLFEFVLELCVQYMPNGAYYNWATETEAQTLIDVRKMWKPTEGRLKDKVRIHVQAPRADTSRESRQQVGLLLTNASRQEVQFAMQIAPMVFPEDPVMAQRYVAEVYSYHCRLMKVYMDDIDLPNIGGEFPDAPERQPADQIIMQLQQQLQQMQMQLQQMQMAQQPQMQPAGPQGMAS